MVACPRISAFAPEVSRSVMRVTRARTRLAARLLRVDNLAAFQLPLDPFLGVDHFATRVPRSPPHPHAGFCALTYLFEDSEGAMVSRDSLGHTMLVRPGDLCWTTAGRGIVHEEVPEAPGRVVHGLQIFVNLAGERKRLPPSVQCLDAPNVPVVLGEAGVRARVVVGSSGGRTSPLTPPTPITLLDVFVPPGGCFEHDVAADDSAIAYVLAGNGTFGATSRALRCRDACAFAHDGDRIAMRAGRSGMRVAVLAGAPLRQPIVASGPFIMSSHEEIEQAFRDYQLGRMGRLAASF